MTCVKQPADSTYPNTTHTSFTNAFH